ncbi:MAG: PIN domain-containing protein [Promethearchaeota archaeon]
MIVVDTTVLIDIRRGRLSIKKLIDILKLEEFYISEMSIKELYDGLGYTRMKLGEEIYQKNKRLIEELLTGFYTIPICARILKLAGLKEGEMRAKGIIIDFEDIIIGISALIKQADWIISRNVKHFKEFTVPCKSYSIE